MNISTLAQRKQTIVIITLAFILVAASFSFLQPISFGAQSKVIVVQQYPDGADPYTLSQSGSYLSIILAEVITTNSFYNEVVRGDFQIDKGYFEHSGDISSTTKNWQKTVSAKTIGDTGIVKINILHPDKEQARNISDGIARTLIDKHAAFHGNGDLVTIKVIDSPIVAQATPNLKMNFAVALALGIIMSILYINAFPSEEHQLKVFKRQSKNNIKADKIDSNVIGGAMHIESK